MPKIQEKIYLEIYNILTNNSRFDSVSNWITISQSEENELFRIDTCSSNPRSGEYYEASLNLEDAINEVFNFLEEYKKHNPGDNEFYAVKIQDTRDNIFILIDEKTYKEISKGQWDIGETNGPGHYFLLEGKLQVSSDDGYGILADDSILIICKNFYEQLKNSITNYL